MQNDTVNLEITYKTSRFSWFTLSLLLYFLWGSLAYVNQPKVLALETVISNISINRTARRLEGDTGKYTDGASLKALWKTWEWGDTRGLLRCVLTFCACIHAHSLMCTSMYMKGYISLG
jgi:hypothetical protein